MTPAVTLDEGLVDEIAAQMDLRVPNAEALAAVAGRLGAHQASGTGEPFESVVDVATGVGKTFVLAAAIEYLAQFGVRNFAVITHRNAILTKTVNNFTPGHDKSIVDRLTVRPTVITVEDLDTGAAQAAMDDHDAIKLYILSIQSLQYSTSNAGRRTRDFREVLGEGFYDRLQSLDDLVVFADEHHCYYGPSFSTHMRGLDPMALVGLTGTPHDRTPESQIIYRYPLAEAIADRLVKTPVIVGRSDDLADDATKLRDGLTLLRAKQRAVDAWVDQTGVPARNLLMLVVTESIDEARDVEALLTSDQVHDGAYADHVLRIDSSQPDEALEELERVEHPDSPVRVIVSVQMLQEGWDVATVAVIVSLRASVSDILTEQTLGRGLRLPWGRYVDVPLLNQLDVVAHERYEEVLHQAGVSLGEQRVDWASWAREQVATAQDLAGQAASTSAADEVRAQLDALVQYRVRDEESGAMNPASRASDVTDLDGDPAGGTGDTGREGTGDSGTSGSVAASMGVARIDDRLRDVEDDADTVERVMRPHPDLPGIRLPLVRTSSVTSNYQLADVAGGLREELRALGASFAADPDDALRRTEVVARVVTGPDGLSHTQIHTRAADDPVLTEVTSSVEPSEVVRRLARAILHSRVATGRRQDLQPARMLAEAVVDGAGDEADVLGRYLDQLAGAVVGRVVQGVAGSSGHVEQVEDIVVSDVDWLRGRHEFVLQDHHGEFNRRAAYAGWERSLYDEVRFDSRPERSMAVILDFSADAVDAWVRLRRNDLAVNWTGTGRQYNPDFLAVEPESTRHGRIVRRCWVIEVKADRDMEDPEVLAKFDAAGRWASRVNADGAADPDEWHVMLASETAIEQARGSWVQLLQRSRTDL